MRTRTAGSTPPRPRSGLLPEPFADIDADRDGVLAEAELKASHDRADDQLPNFAIPELNSVGAQEIFVTAAHGVGDFISAMDTDRIREWNAWYHLMNCGLPVKASGETDFPCMSGTRVGQGRSYVQLGKQARVDYPQWCEGIARGRSYVSDGYAHALEFTVNGRTSGDDAAAGRAGQGDGEGKRGLFAGDAARAGLRRRDSRWRPAARRRHGHHARNAVAGSRLPARAAARRVGRQRPRGGAAAKCRRTDASTRSSSRCRSSAAAGSRCGSFRSCTRIPVNVARRRESRSARRAKARSGRSPASISSGACARGSIAPGRARRRGEGLRRGAGDLSPDRGGIAGGSVSNRAIPGFHSGHRPHERLPLRRLSRGACRDAHTDRVRI